MFQYEKNGVFNRKETKDSFYNKFMADRKYFRLIISTEVKNQSEEWYDLQGTIYYQLWQSIDQPWVFLLYVDISELEATAVTLIKNAKKYGKDPIKITPSEYFNNILTKQKGACNIIIEGEQKELPRDLFSHEIIRPYLTNDPFNKFTTFQQIFRGTCNNGQYFEYSKQENIMHTYRGLELNRKQVERLLFHALRHPEQYVKETIGESIDQLLSSFENLKRENNIQKN